ncbi:histidine phosphatase family protein [Geodermatophilus sp. DSM 45219]|uniref:histidine phosphatase family protein n=1 Tax=Geodermatophilus sp. DSM 45219 TaxID=1881103 RepID=UPI0008874C0D|nr:histidine phosphatase family protein [Geodermatophilus sp. DSM 45219]SDN97167.1 probable phosphoglycerate mutase [Geodermatophilus sp. DSM 45219]
MPSEHRDTDVLLVRHGEVVHADPEHPHPLLEDGQGDPPLSALGRAQAEAVGRRLRAAGLDAVYVTTLRRTLETAQPLIDVTGIRPRVEPDLRELHLGEWEDGLVLQRLAQGDPVAARVVAEQRWDLIPGAEPAAALAVRVRAALQRIAAAHPGGRVAVFTHGGVIAQALALATEAPPFAFLSSRNSSLSQLALAGERWTVRRFNDTAHLDDDLLRVGVP